VIVHRVVKNVKKDGQYIEPHSHAFFHYIYALRGRTCVRIEGEQYETEPRSLTLISPGMTHSITSLGTSCCLDLKFSCSEPLLGRIKGLPVYIQSIDPQFNSLIRNIFEEAVSQEQDYDEVINIRLYELLIRLLRRQDGREARFSEYAPVAEVDNHNIRMALQLVEEQLALPLRVTDLAARCGYSENYFRQAFQKYVGISPNTYINQRKISKAKELMLYSDLNITQTAERLGFQSIHYFSRLFKRLTGVSPTEYIDRVKENRPINVVQNVNTPQGEFEIPIQDRARERGKKSC